MSAIYEGAIIGPLELDLPNVNRFDFSKFMAEREINDKGRVINLGRAKKTESFKVLAPIDQINQLLGFNDWEEILWIDGSPILQDNIDMPHRGFYVFRVGETEFKGQSDYALVELTGVCLSRDRNSYFSRDFSLVNQLTYDYPGVPSGGGFTESYNGLIISNGNTLIDTTTKSQLKSSNANANMGWDYRSGGWGSWASGSSGRAYTNLTNPDWYLTNWYRKRNIGFSIPINSEILGLKAHVSIGVAQTNNLQTFWQFVKPDGTGSPTSHSTDLQHGDGVNLSFGGYWLGSSSDLWGFTDLTPEDINSSNFRIRAYGGGIRPNFHLYIGPPLEVEVYYRFNVGYYTRYQYINPAHTDWGTLGVTQNIPSNTSITWDIYRASDNYLLATGLSGDSIDLSGFAHVDLKMVATFTANGTTSPYISAVNVSETGSA